MLLSEFKPAVVSFHFGLPSAELLAAVKAPVRRSSRRRRPLDEALWLEAHGADAIIAQGLEAGGHRGMFLSDDLTTQIGTLALVPQIVAEGAHPRDCRRRHCRFEWRRRGDGARSSWSAGGNGLSVVPGSHDERAAPRGAQE